MGILAVIRAMLSLRTFELYPVSDTAGKTFLSLLIRAADLANSGDTTSRVDRGRALVAYW